MASRPLARWELPYASLSWNFSLVLMGSIRAVLAVVLPFPNSNETLHLLTKLILPYLPVFSSMVLSFRVHPAAIQYTHTVSFLTKFSSHHYISSS